MCQRVPVFDLSAQIKRETADAVVWKPVSHENGTSSDVFTSHAHKAALIPTSLPPMTKRWAESVYLA